MRVYVLILCLVLLQQEGRARPEPLGCSSPEALQMAEEVLEQVNQDRTSGYILAFNRLYDIRSTGTSHGILFTLSIDVTETKCHVTSRKPWKQCKVRDMSEVPVYGECEVSAFLEPRVKLQSYFCAIREVNPLSVWMRCPDCPTVNSLSNPVIMETANLSLQKFNKESGLTNFFALGNITKASSQWVFGMSYFVEFTIVETVCSKKTDASELSSCQPMNFQFAHQGFCSASHMSSDDEVDIVPHGGTIPRNSDVIDVKCEIFEPQAAAAEKEAHAKADSKHIEPQHQNHTHLHPHEHEHTLTPGPQATVSTPGGALGTVVTQPAGPRATPTAGSCPGPARHYLNLLDL